jgi:hypothetical protein
LAVAALAWLTPMPASGQPAASATAPVVQASVLRLSFTITIGSPSFRTSREGPCIVKVLAQ